SQQGSSNLWAVSVCDDESVITTDELDDAGGGAASIGALLGDSSLLSCANQGVATDRDEQGLHSGARVGECWPPSQSAEVRSAGRPRPAVPTWARQKPVTSDMRGLFQALRHRTDRHLMFHQFQHDGFLHMQ